MSDTEEIAVCKESDIEENQLKLIVNEEKGDILLVKQNGEIHALGSKCTHYGASLENAVLGKGRIRCPHHGACFNIKTGDIEDFPGLDSLPSYRVTVDDGDVRVRMSRGIRIRNLRSKPFCTRDFEVLKTFIIIGSGPAGLNCAETLRQENFKGLLVMLTDEIFLPYDRVTLSKTLNPSLAEITLRYEEFYNDRNIEVLKRAEVNDVDTSNKSVTLKTGERYIYDQLFIASGASPVLLRVRGSNLQNIFGLRTYIDAKTIFSRLSDDKKVAIIGSSFLAMEVASTIANQVHSVCIITKEKLPFLEVFGEQIARRIKKLYDDHKVIFHLQSEVREFYGTQAVEGVLLKSGTKVEANICIVGIGVRPNTKFLRKDQIKMTGHGHIIVDENLFTNEPDVLAGGDVASAPILQSHASITHWGVANYHGHVAALNMIGRRRTINTVPFFWTVLFHKTFKWAGFFFKYDDVVICGNVEDMSFVAYYCLDQKVLAVTSVDRDPVAAKFAELLHEKKELLKSDIPSWLF